MSNGTAQADSALAGHRVLRELGTRSPRTFAAARQDGSLVVLHRFTRGPHADAELVSAEEMAILLRDARCLAKNWHPNIARVRHVELDGGALDLATELVDGVTFEELLTLAAARRAHPEEPVLSHAILARISLDVLAGLSALHALRDGINAPLNAFHGALCPANVVIGKDGVARLVCALRPRPVKIGAASSAVGYASPETLAEEKAQDGRVDIYAAGVMLWEAITERRLYDETSPQRVAQRQRAEDVARPEARLADVVMRAIAFDPAVRFRTANEMAAGIRALAGTVAQGSLVAQTIAELAGDQIRARRSELEGSGPHPVVSTMRSGPRMRSQQDALDTSSSDASTDGTPELRVTPVSPPPSSSSSLLATMTARELRPSAPEVETSYAPRPKPARRATGTPPPPSPEPASVHARPLRGTPSSLPPACVEDDDDLPGPRQSTPDDGYLEQLANDHKGPRSSSSVLTTNDLAGQDEDLDPDPEDAAALEASREVVLSTRATTPPPLFPPMPEIAPPASTPFFLPVASRSALPIPPPSQPRREPSTRTPFVVDVMPDVRISSEDLGTPRLRPAALLAIAAAAAVLAIVGGVLVARSSSSDAPASSTAAGQPPSAVVIAPPPSVIALPPAGSAAPSASSAASVAPITTPDVPTPKKRSVYDPASY